MSFWGYVSLVVGLWPDIKRLILTIEQNAREGKTEAEIRAKVKNDLGVISNAFAKKDAEALRALFNTR
jgi:hypothetical protein